MVIAGNQEIIVVGKGVAAVRQCCASLKILNAAAHAVELHDYVGCAIRPEDWAVLAIVGNRPDAGGGLDQGLVAVIVELG